MASSSKFLSSWGCLFVNNLLVNLVLFSKTVFNILDEGNNIFTLDVNGGCSQNVFDSLGPIDEDHWGFVDVNFNVLGKAIVVLSINLNHLNYTGISVKIRLFCFSTLHLLAASLKA